MLAGAIKSGLRILKGILKLIFCVAVNKKCYTSTTPVSSIVVLMAVKGRVQAHPERNAVPHLSPNCLKPIIRSNLSLTESVWLRWCL